jgi:hypothetical protein
MNVEQLEEELRRIERRGLELTAEMRECNDPQRKTALRLEALNWMLRGQNAQVAKLVISEKEEKIRKNRQKKLWAGEKKWRESDYARTLHRALEASSGWLAKHTKLMAARRTRSSLRKTYYI